MKCEVSMPTRVVGECIRRSDFQSVHGLAKKHMGTLLVGGPSYLILSRPPTISVFEIVARCDFLPSKSQICNNLQQGK
jgi:hypothetical protein